MSNSFRIIGGDLVVGARRSFDTVSGKDKLFQDLKLWILERVGTDPLTPTYGSRLDGGVIDGQEVPSHIGQLATQERRAEIQEEIASLLTRYQQEQLDKMRREMVLFSGKHTLKDTEILYSVESITTALVNTTILVRVICNTLAGESFKLIIPAAI